MVIIDYSEINFSFRCKDHYIDHFHGPIFFPPTQLHPLPPFFQFGGWGAKIIINIDDINLKMLCDVSITIWIISMVQNISSYPPLPPSPPSPYFSHLGVGV